jgi:chemotaxis protein MotA
MALIGIIIVLLAVGGGFAIAGGSFPVLIQPSEFVVIVGAAVGTLIASSPGRMRARVFHVLGAAFKDAIPKKQDYIDLLKLQFEIFSLMRRDGQLAIEPHLTEPSKSDLFRKYASVARQHLALSFLVEALQQVVNGVSPEELDQALDAELETAKEEGHMPVALLKGVGDALPGIGIVAAVLGIIVTMNHMDAPPAVIGHHVAAALVGTFLGILLCYGIIQPLATSVESQEVHQLRYLLCIKQGVLATMRGCPPSVAVDFARKVIFNDERPSFAETDKILRATKGGA